MFRISFILAIIITMTVSSLSQTQTDESKYRIFDSRGNPATMSDILKQVEISDVVFLGENHDDKIAHELQLGIFTKAFQKLHDKKNIALSLEMFERDTQIVLDEYLKDLIAESHFLSSSRPWNNYETDYRPLVEFAKENKLKVIAANAPRRYVNMVSRLGKKSLDELSSEAREWLAPLPFNESSKAYSDKFNALMGGHGSSNILESQTLWDATMADSISRYLRKTKKPFVVHLNGSFHTENRLGTVEQLLKSRRNARVLVVTMKYEEDFKNFDKSKHLNLGDFVILTDAKEPRSKR